MGRNPAASRVSVHGGHSGQFCTHAVDSLEDVVKTYIDQGFAWVGITEHMPAAADGFVFEDERRDGFDSASLRSRFARYISTCRGLQQKYRDQIELLVAFETETYSGSAEFVRQLRGEFKPDYIVGSLHHVDDREFDYTREGYLEAADALGGLDALYCRYFDEQYTMIETLEPEVVGHFDLIRLFDPDYARRLNQPAIKRRIHRNLDLVRQLDLILDCNLKGFGRPPNAASQPNPERNILAAAIERGIAIVPGDDSHGTRSVGRHYDDALTLLEELGANLDWKKPI